MIIGGATIYVGIVSVIIGLLLVFWFLISHRRSLERIEHEAAKVVGLLLVNIPVAVLIMLAVSHILWVYTLTVENNSSVPLEAFQLSGPMNDEFPPVDIDPGQSRQFHLRFENEGKLTFATTLRGNSISGLVEGYAFAGDNGRRTLTFDENGDFVMTDKSRNRY